jgi:hypothetical protein
MAEYEQAIDTVISLAQHSLHLFDADLTSGGFSSRKRYEALRDFLRRHRNNRLVLVLHDLSYLTAHCPRLMDLLKTHGHGITIQQTHAHARSASDPFLIADDAHYVHRFHQQGRRFLLARQDPAGARELQERFGQLLEASHPAAPATTLGL